MDSQNTFCRKAFQLFSLVFLTGSIVACGGGGGATGGNNPPPPTNVITRPTVIAFDNDNNGITDATSTLTYDNAGRVTREEYIYTGDGVQDAFDLYHDEATQIVNEFVYDGNGRLLRHRRTDSNGSAEYRHSYDGNGNVTRIDVTTITAVGTVDTYIAYSYNGNQAQQFDIRLSSDNMLLLTESYAYDLQGRVVQDLGILSAGGVGYERRYSWDMLNRLDLQEHDGNGDGIYEITYDYIFNDTSGKLEQRINMNLVAPAPAEFENFTEHFTYNTGGQLETIEYDNNNDGTLDATATVTVRENGPCAALYLPILSKKAGQDGIPGSLVGDIVWCE